MPDIKVFYVGDKPTKKDTVTGSKHIWRGFGQYRLVSEIEAQRLLDFPSVWVNEHEFERMKNGEHGPVTGSGLADGIMSAGNSGSVGATDLDTPSRENQICDAIGDLDRPNKDHFTGTGMPKLEAVREVMADDSVEKAELNAAWNTVKHLYTES